MSKIVIITGSTKGLGLALAYHFLQQDHKVVISSSSEKRVKIIENLLSKKFNNIIAQVADVTKYDQLKSLANKTVYTWDRIDYWINNAGTNTYQAKKLGQMSAKDIESIADTNLKGTMLGCKAALMVMDEGHIFNMDGLGSNGRIQVGYSVYGSTKRAIPYLTEALVKAYYTEKIGIHTLSPGMVITDLLTKPADISSFDALNFLAETPMTVAEYLVNKILNIRGTGKYIKYLNKWKIVWRYLTAWRYKGRFIEDGKLKVKPVKEIISEQFENL